MSNHYYRLVLGRGPGREREVTQTVYLDFKSAEEAAKIAANNDENVALVWVEKVVLETTIYPE